MSKYVEKLSTLTDIINKSIAELDLPIKGAGLVIDWDMEKIPASEANDGSRGRGMLMYPGKLTTRDVLNMQRYAGEFIFALTTMAMDAVAERPAAADKSDGSIGEPSTT